jgi:hypothetical protein
LSGGLYMVAVRVAVAAVGVACGRERGHGLAVRCGLPQIFWTNPARARAGERRASASAFGGPSAPMPWRRQVARISGHALFRARLRR